MGTVRDNAPMNGLKVGDKVRCIDTSNGWAGWGLEDGGIYTVTDVVYTRGEAFLKLEGLVGDRAAARFELVTDDDFKPTIEIDGEGYKRSMDDPNKLPLDLVSPQFIEDMAKVLQKGALKYSPFNWARGMSWEHVMGALQRHLTAFRKGEEVDEESGVSHLAHAACCLMFLHWYSEGPQKDEYQKFDDRFFKNG